MELVKWLGRSAYTNLDYHLNFDKAVSDLRRECGALKSRKDDINLKLQIQVLPWGKEVKHEVQSWLDHVQETNNEVQAIQGKIQKVKWCSRGRLGKLVCKKIKEVKKISEQCSFPNSLVVDKPPCGIIMPTENVVGEDSVTGKIWGYLIDNEVGMIGVCGIAGVGKTTIMKKINNELVRQTKFDKVIWVTVSHPLDVIKLQENIARAFAVEHPKGEDKERCAAELMSIMGRVRHMLILDDVWENFSLNEVGIPRPTIESGSKIVITSRLIDVCQKMGCEIVKVEPLSFQESLNLFLDRVGSQIVEVPNLEGILKLIVKECGGLPLAIVVIAESMKEEDNVHVWKNALNELQEQVKSVTGLDQKLFKRLRFSYDNLNNFEIQNCFLYCSLFPEDYPFAREELIEGWIDEGLIDVLPSRKVAHERGQDFLNRLVKSCLLEKTVDWSGDVFKMHDVVRDMATISIGPEFGYMVKAGMKLTEVSEERGWGNDLKKVSLMENDISKIPLGLSPKCPTLSTLILSNNYNLLEIPKSFFEEMPELKVLDLSKTNIEALPNSISNLTKLSSLRLWCCRSLRYLPSLAKLGKLRKLDLNSSRIEVVPQGMEELRSLEYLDLSDCRNLKEIQMGMLSKLSNLQYLLVYGELKIKGGELEIKGEEVASLRKLETFEGVFDNIQGFSYFVQSCDFRILTNYKIAVGAPFSIMIGRRKPVVNIYNCDLWGVRELPASLQSLVIDHCQGLTLNSFPVHIFSNLKILHIWYCSGTWELRPLKLPQAFQNLEEIIVWDCKQMTEIIASSDSDASLDNFTFPKLRRLSLRNLPQLKSICSAKRVMICYSIEEITIWRCQKLKRIPVQLHLLDNGQTSPLPRLRRIWIDEESKEWWESVEWDNKNLLQPFLKYY